MKPHKLWSDENHFVLELKFDGKTVVYVFPIDKLANGASLSRMMNLKVRETVRNYDGMVSTETIKQASREGLAQLREFVEEYFTERGIGNGSN